MRHLLTAALALLLTLPTGVAAQPPGTETYHGFDVALLAEALANLTTFRTRDGESGGDASFAGWLAQRGHNRSDYEHAYAAWWERFRADPSGQLEARFLRINAEFVQQLNFGDAADRRQETREGVSLETYAKIAVALTRLPGADLGKVVREHGLRNEDHWQKVNEAWAAAMKEDTTYALVQQYAALYQKFAGPQFAAEQDAVVANSLANRPTVESPRETPAPPTIDDALARLDDNDQRERWSAAREVMRLCDLWRGPARRPAADPRARHCTDAALRASVHPLLVEAIDRFDDKTVNYATGMLDMAKDVGLFDAEVEMAVRRALARSTEQLATLEAAFAPIRDKAVPERLTLRAKIDEYTAAVRDFRAALAK